MLEDNLKLEEAIRKEIIDTFIQSVQDYFIYGEIRPKVKKAVKLALDSVFDGKEKDVKNEY